MAKLYRALGTMVVLGLAVVVLLQQQRAKWLVAEASALRQEVADVAARQQESKRLASPRPDRDEALAEDQFRELLRLRGQVGSLRRELRELRQKHPTASPSGGDPTVATITLAALEQFNEQASAKAVFAKNWMSAFIEYAQENGGRLPTNFDQAAPFLSDTARAETNLSTDQFEIVYCGYQNDITNTVDGDLIVLRERQVWQDYLGRWGRIYGLADGRGLQRWVKDRDALEQWEDEHLRSNIQR